MSLPVFPLNRPTIFTATGFISWPNSSMDSL
jgi:hypothetical protein